MKKNILAILIVVLAILLSFSTFANAATFKDFTYELSKDYFTRSNPANSEDKDELDHSRDVSYGSVKIFPTNGSYTISSTTMVLSDLIYYNQNPSNYDIMQTHGSPYEEESSKIYNAFVITPADSSSVSVDFIIPAELDAINDNGKVKEHSFFVNIAYNNGTADLTERVEIKFKVQNELILVKDKVSFVSDTTDASCNMADKKCDKTINEFIPGEDIVMSFSIKNNLRSIDMEDVIYEINLNGDVDEDEFEDDFNSIDGRGTEEISISIEPDSDAEGNLNVEILVYGEDEFGSLNGFYYEFDDLEFNVPKYRVRLDLNAISPSKVCVGDDVTVSYKVTNIGSKNQKKLQTIISENKLGWSKTTNVFSLDGEDDGDYESESFEETFFVPSNAKEGTYSPKVTVYYEDGTSIKTIYSTLNFVVEDCSPPIKTEVEKNDSKNTTSNTGTIIINPNSTTSIPTTSNNNVVVATPQSVDTGFWIMIGVIVLLVLAIITLLVYLLKK